MTVDSFDPKQLKPEANSETLQHFLTASERLDDAQFGLDEVSAKRLGLHARQGPIDWLDAVQDLGDEAIVALIKLFTLAEMQLVGWESSAKSPVIPLVRVLKQRGSYPEDLTAWIKSNTDNRFLPHGSLMDRL